MLETLSAPVPPPVNPEAPQLSTEQGCPPSLDPSSTQIQPITHPAATSSPQKQAADRQDLEGTVSQALREESGPLLYLSEGQQDSLRSDEVARPGSDSGCEANKPTDGTGKSDFDLQERAGGAEAEPASAQQPPQSKKDKLAMLRKLRLNPPPVAKLRPDDGAFVKLDPPQLNPGR